ncbi:pilus assembly protein TadG-related protein [Thioclava sp. FR2]|uniref:pilus assembly protein TadG-related protein n=1 Tax=Thioclava sp. FR2 TaxID=3445780 RepID=UPI003EC01178
MNRDAKPAANTRLSPWTAFVRNEDGTILFFAVVLMLLMLMLAGMGVDIMRFETTRNELQQTLDRATLASASITQDLDPEAVVRDYFDKAGLSDQLKDVRVTTGMNFRTVAAEARADTNPIFLRLYQTEVVDQIEARAFSEAEQRITNVEIALVLDVSGSMGGAKLTNLKTAAKEFVRTVLEADGEGRISIFIVPYNGQVNMSQEMQNLFINRTNDHNVTDVNCFDLPSSVYSGLGLPITTTMPVTGHVDTFSSTSYSTSYVSATGSSATPNPANRWCLQSTNNVILPATNVISRLENHIDGLTAGGATSINAGMKWGMALLDPESRAITSAMVATGRTPAQFAGRPYNYVDNEAMKVVVLMTDGEHFAEERLNSGYRTEDSPIFKGSDGYYSLYQNRANTSNDYWVPHRNEWRSQPWPDSTRAARQKWNQVWENLRMTWVAWQLYARANGNSSSVYYSTMDMFRSKTATTDMDSQLQGVCNRARDNDVIVYGIAFEAPANGQAQIQACSTTPSHYFNAAGLEIQSAFRAIASNISQLRLTQ